MRRAVRSIPLVLVALSFAAVSSAQIKPRHSDVLLNKVIAPAGFVATVAPESSDALAAQLDGATLGDINAFRQSAGAWKFFVDRRSGGVALAEGRGIRWSGASLDDHAASAVALMTQYPALFQVSLSQLALDRDASLNFGEQKQYWNIVFTQSINHVPVDDARVVFRVNNGNLVQFGVDRTLPARALESVRISPIGVAQARASLATHLGGLLPTDIFSEDGAMLWFARGSADSVGYTGAVGLGWQPTLAYRFTFERDGSIGTWQALVDAGTGSVIRFVDANAYAGEQVTAKASVYTLTNCEDPTNCVPGNQNEAPVTMPHARIEFVGGTCTGDGCFTNSAGAYTYPTGAQTSTTILDGKYFQVVDTCGVTSPLGLRPEGIDLGTSAKLTTGTNTDCAPATMQSAPGSGPLFAGLGDTHSARNTYYHLNLIGEKSRFYLPHNEWLKGVDGANAATIPILVNLPPACNALWNGLSLNFMRVTNALFCNNTGELPDVFLHEYGHGLDQNDLTGTAPESATGEAMGDTFALLEGQHSCIGVGFRLNDPTDPAWGSSAGYGNGSRRCSGVRDLDYTKFCLLPDRLVSLPINIAPRPEGCRALAIDPDAPNGSRAGLNPPAEPAGEIGTPARWNHMIATAPVGVADGQSNFWNCGGPETTGCAGPLNHGCHCESVIASQANWDMSKRLIKTRYGGDVYGLQGPKEISGWQVMDRLWYLTRDIAISAYSVTGAGQTNGCGIDNWYATYRFIDDNNGDLADGTPNSDVMFAAFDQHAIACGTAGDATNQSNGCGTPLPAPTLSVCDNKTPVVLRWSAVSGAAQYRILRNTIGANFGYKPIAVVPASQHEFSDSDVAPGVAYFYTVQPVAAGSCYGQASNSVAVTPDACPVSSIAAPTGLTLSIAGANRVNVSWSAVSGAGSYLVYRKDGTCDVAGSYSPVAIVTGTNWVDTNVQGTINYSYRVAASESSCATCPSAQSSCESISATGSCNLPPSFAGVRSVTSSSNGVCKLSVNWSPAQANCGGNSVTYSVYRSTSADFVPAAANRIAAGLAGTSYSDYTVTSGTRYYYAVRATDAAGNTENNSVKRYEVANGTLVAGTFKDDGGDTAASQMFKVPSASNNWTVRPTGAGNTTKHYATSAAAGYADNACMRLETPTLSLEEGATLSFRTKYLIEPGWDGGYVEVATEGSGFSNWTKLTSITYPGIMAGTGDPACGGPGFADGEPVVTGSSGNQWLPLSGSLNDYAGNRVRLRFIFGSDASTAVALDGWLIDDIQVTNVLLANGCAPAPSAAPTSVSPSAGPTAGGTGVTISGNAFENGATVSFGGNAASSVTWVSPTKITAVTPPGSGYADLTVTNPTGMGGTLPAAFRYLAAPALTSASEPNGPVAGGQSVTINGTNLDEIVEVTFGGTQATITGSNGSSVTVVTPAHAAGVVSITVTTAGGSATLANAYTYLNAPVVTSLSKRKGSKKGGEQVTISGSYLSNAVSVSFGGSYASILQNTNSSIRVSTPAHAPGEVDVTVTTRGGSTTVMRAYQFK
jgi:fibronectin type 3 domain-containing protein